VHRMSTPPTSGGSGDEPQQPGDQEPYGQTQPYGQQPYGQPYGNPPYGTQPYGTQPYGQPYGNQPQPYGQPPPYGHPQPGYPPQAYPVPGTNGMAIASLVLGILWIYWIGSILALILGHVAKRQIRRTGETGGGMATAGIVLGWIGIAVLVIMGIVLGFVATSSP
jgi:hypothetical protein